MTAPEPSPEQVAAWLRDPRNREVVAEVLRREALARAPWLLEFARREARVRGEHRL